MGIPDNHVNIIRRKKVDCTVVSIGDQVKIIPSNPLTLNANYLITCSSELKSSMGININPFNIAFSTENPFRVISFRQYGSSITDTVIRITFSSMINEATLGNIIFKGLLDIPYSYNIITSKVIDIYPNESLTEGELYTVTVPTGVKDIDGKALTEEASYQFTGMTVNPLAIVSTTPIDETTGVLVDSSIEVDFNNDIDPSSVNIDTIWIEEIIEPPYSNLMITNENKQGMMPNGYYTFYDALCGDMYLAWDTTISGNVKIEMTRTYDNEVTIIAESTSNDGTYTWVQEDMGSAFFERFEREYFLTITSVEDPSLVFTSELYNFYDIS